MNEKDPLTESIIGCCFKIHKDIGPGFNEKIYCNALKLSFGQKDLKYQTEKQFDVFYHNKIIGKFKVDFVIESKVIVEVKSVDGIMPKVFGAQVISYLKASTLKVGLLINFGNKSCQIKRFIL